MPDQTPAGALWGARRFLQWLRVRHPGHGPGTMTQQVVAAVGTPANAVRSLEHAHGSNVSYPRISRFPRAGHHHRDLSPVVPRTPHWRLAHLPPRLSWTEVRRSPPPARIVDAGGGEVFIRHTKGKRDRVVPLLEETGAALADYILAARPKVDSAHLFLTFRHQPVTRMAARRRGSVALLHHIWLAGHADNEIAVSGSLTDGALRPP